MDIFVRSLVLHPLRAKMRELCLERWKLEPDITVIPIVEHTANPRFPRYSRETAESWAKSDPYLFIDDDQLPVGADWIKRGLEICDRNSHYALLSAWSINGEVPLSRADGESELFHRDSLGTPCFVRKGTFVDLPDGELESYDITLSHYLRSKGLKFAFMRDLRFNHIGYGYSTAVKGHWQI